MLFAIAGMMLMAMASDLLLIFLALEALSLAVYVLTGIRRDVPTAIEGAFKYFLLGAFSSAFFLCGIAFTYGLTGTTRLDRIASILTSQASAPTPLQLVAIGLLLVGFAFKISAVPFQMWTPDAYEGAPPAVTGFMSTGVKAAAFAAFVRVFLAAFYPLRSEWSGIVMVVAAATMIVGTVVGVAQSNVKRMLAYSSIAHGEISAGGTRVGERGRDGGDLFYLLSYALTNLGAFGVIALLDTAQWPNDQVRDYGGLWNEHPILAGLMTVFLLSLGGFPPTSGFIAKWYSLHGGRGSRALLARDHRRSDERRLGVFLPAHCRHDAMTPTESPVRVPAISKACRCGTGRFGHPDFLSRNSAHARARIGPPPRSGRSSSRSLKHSTITTETAETASDSLGITRSGLRAPPRTRVARRGPVPAPLAGARAASVRQLLLVTQDLIQVDLAERDEGTGRIRRGATKGRVVVRTKRSRRYAFAAGSVVICATRSSLTRRSWNVRLSRSLRPRACGE